MLSPSPSSCAASPIPALAGNHEKNTQTQSHLFLLRSKSRSSDQEIFLRERRNSHKHTLRYNTLFKSSQKITASGQAASTAPGDLLAVIRKRWAATQIRWIKDALSGEQASCVLQLKKRDFMALLTLPCCSVLSGSRFALETCPTAVSRNSAGDARANVRGQEV